MTQNSRLKTFTAIGALVATVVLTACGSPAALPARQVAAGEPAPAHLVGLIGRSQDLGPISPSARVTVLLALRDPMAARRAAQIRAMYRPGPDFMRFATWSQVASEGAPARLARLAQRILQRDGLAASWQPGATWMSVSGPARRVEAVFKVPIHAYLSPGGVSYYASTSNAVIPAGLRGEIAGAGSISSYPVVHTASIPAKGLTPANLLALYGWNPPSGQTFDGTGQTVAVVEIDGFAQADLDAFTNKFHLPPLKPQIKFGGPLSPGGETEMDIEVIHAIAPQAAITVYNCADPCSGSSLLDAITHAIHDTPHGIISMSLIGCELDDTAAGMNTISSTENAAAAVGTSYYISAGDSGAYECLTDDWNSPPVPKYITVSDLSSAADVTSVGGTHVSVNGDGTRYKEEVWANPAQTSGTGGGVSQFVPIPDYQKGVLQSQDNPNSMRQQPDVSADADPATGAAINVEGNWTQGGGTSQAAPIWAGLTALINQYLLSKHLPVAGFVNPALYALAAGNPKLPPFYDVTAGNNLHYSAQPGYDLATGLGTPNAWNLAQDLELYLRNGGHL